MSAICLIIEIIISAKSLFTKVKYNIHYSGYKRLVGVTILFLLKRKNADVNAYLPTVSNIHSNDIGSASKSTNINDGTNINCYNRSQRLFFPRGLLKLF